MISICDINEFLKAGPHFSEIDVRNLLIKLSLNMSLSFQMQL